MAVEKTITKDAKVGTKIKAACVLCGPKKTHAIVASMEEHNSDTGPREYQWINRYEVIQCAGCDTYSFRKMQSNSEDFNPETEEYDELIELYPSRVSGRAPVNEYALLPNDLQRIYLETLKALNSEQPVLAGIGLRAIVEAVCKDQLPAGGNLYSRIEELVTRHLLSRSGADVLHKLRVLGNDAAHEVKPHDVMQLGFGLDVIDNLVSSVYILPRHAQTKFQ